MARYRFVSSWRIAAPVQDVWSAIHDAQRWPTWWPSVRSVEVIEPGDEAGVGRLLRFTFTTRLPYTISFESRIVEVSRPHAIEGRVQGELDGSGRWELAAEDAGETVARYTWDVRTTKPWMNLLAPLAGPVFRWNHDALMREGGECLAALLDATLIDASGEQEIGPPLAGPAVAIAAAGLVTAAVLTRRVARARH